MKTFKQEIEQLTEVLEKIIKTPSFYNYDREMVEDFETSPYWKKFIKQQADSLTAVKMFEMLENIEEINDERIYIFTYSGETSSDKVYNFVEEFYSTYLIFIIRTFEFFDCDDDDFIFTDTEMLAKLKAILQDKKFEEEILNY